MINKKAKVLIFDIETMPHVAYVWQFWKQNIGHNQVHEHGYIASFAAKWLGEDDVFYYENRTGDDKEIVTRMFQLFEEADIVVAHNAKRFDVPTVLGRGIIHGLNPPAPFKIVDTLLVARAKFRFPRNTLAFIADALGCAPKLDHGKFAGFELWLQCMKQNDEAWAEMQTYNIQDVATLEEVYLKLRPWMNNHPNVAVMEEKEEPVCPKCGGKHLHRRGYFVTNAGKYAKLQCQTCKGWCSERTNVLKKEVRKPLLKNVG